MPGLERLVELLGRRKLNVSEVFSKIKKVTESMGCKAYLVGSWAEGRATPASDVDILVVCKELSKSMLDRGKIVAEILERAGVPDYEDAHLLLIDEEELPYYSLFFKNLIEELP